MENELTDYELFLKYTDMWKDEFKELIEKLMNMNARHNQNLDETKKDTIKLFKGIMDSYHVEEKYHRLTDATNT